MQKKKGFLMVNNLDKIFCAMKSRKYAGVCDTRGNVHVGLVNGIMPEDGSGKNWLVTISNKTVQQTIFIHAK